MATTDHFEHYCYERIYVYPAKTQNCSSFPDIMFFQDLGVCVRTDMVRQSHKGKWWDNFVHYGSLAILILLGLVLTLLCLLYMANHCYWLQTFSLMDKEKTTRHIELPFHIRGDFSQKPLSLVLPLKTLRVSWIGEIERHVKALQ